MERDVYISIRGLHQVENENGDESDIELVTPGHYYKRNGKHYVSYKEQFSLDSQGRTATVKIDNQCLMVSTHGEMGGQLQFEPGKRNTTFYETPFGYLQMGVTTQSLQMDLQEHQWNIDVDYSIDINHQYTGDHEVHIKVHDGKAKEKISLTS